MSLSKHYGSTIYAGPRERGCQIPLKILKIYLLYFKQGEGGGDRLCLYHYCSHQPNFQTFQQEHYVMYLPNTGMGIMYRDSGKSKSGRGKLVFSQESLLKCLILPDNLKKSGDFLSLNGSQR